MSIFTIADLHLSFSSNKPMDIFNGWNDYTRKLEENWQYRVGKEDTVVLIGDISWAMNFKELEKDFEFINALNGNKIIIKGNHDYWWTTAKKMNEFLQDKGFCTISILNNNAFLCEDTVICGTRGWVKDASTSKEDEKVYLRECGRLEASIKDGLKFGLPMTAFLHYPPIWDDYEATAIIELLKKYDIKKCFYGHIHGASQSKAIIGEKYGIHFQMVSCDYIEFTPFLI